MQPKQHLLRTKLYKPRSVGTWVARPRLLQALDEGLSRKLILVDAPAGYGKTTLLAQWLNAQSLGSAWLSLDVADNDLGVFLSYLAQAVRTIQPDSMGETAMLLSAAHMPPVEQLASTLINELDALPDEIILVLDDFHVVQSPAIVQLVSRLVEHPPSSLHLVLAARSDPSLPLAKLRARGESLELRAADLRFSPDEAREFLHREGQIGLDEDAIQMLEARTEGWPAGMRLGVLSLRNSANPNGFIKEFAAGGSAQVTDFLANEIFANLAPPMQDFLMRISVLDRFCAPLCAALREGGDGGPDHEGEAEDSGTLLSEVGRRNLFLIPLDNSGEWFRFHHLFRDLLRTQLQARMSKAVIAGLHARASDWLAAHGWPEEALQQARLSGDMKRVVRLVEANVHTILNREEWITLVRWLAQVPEEIVQRRPRLLLAQAYVKLMRDELADVPILVDEAERLLQDGGRGGGLDMSVGEIEAAHGEVLGLRTHLSISVGQRGVELAETALRLLPDRYRYARGLVLMFMATHMLTVGQKGEAEARLRLAALQVSSSDAISLRILFAQCILIWAAGEIAPAEALIERFLAASEEAGLMDSICWAHTYAGERYHEINDLERAIEHLEVVVSHAHQAVFICQALARMQLALAQQAAGRPELADAVMRDLRAHARTAQTVADWWMFDALEARLRLLRGDAVGAVGALRWLLPPSQPIIISELLYDELPNLARAQMLIAQRSPVALDEALALLHELRRETEGRQLHYPQAKVMAAQASALYVLNQRDEALRVMEAAVEIGERGGLIRAFVDLGPDVLTVMRALAERAARGSLRHDYLTRVIAAFGSPPVADTANATLVEPVSLTLRECEVLALLDRNRSDKEIAEALVLSRLTVSRHTANIYRKLGVSNRRQAVAKARTLGVLPRTA